jgi:aminoglycoside phosphotransferase (APT) family kinase protein
VQFSLGDVQGLTESFVQKYSRPQEREAMVLLDSIGDEHPLPRLLGSGEDKVGLWLLIPYMDGILRKEFTLPDDVIRTLAHVHSRFENEEMLAKVLPRLNADFLVRALDRIQTALDMKEGRSDSHCSFLHDGITRLREAPQILATVQHLPQTLLHGDVHPGNIIECHSECSVLFDWGNAMVGPAGVDLSNCIASIDTPAWNQYWNIVGQLKNEPVAEEYRAAQFSVGKVMISIQYLPFSIEHFSESDSERMLREALQHCAALDGFP